MGALFPKLDLGSWANRLDEGHMWPNLGKLWWVLRTGSLIWGGGPAVSGNFAIGCRNARGDDNRFGKTWLCTVMVFLNVSRSLRYCYYEETRFILVGIGSWRPFGHIAAPAKFANFVYICITRGKNNHFPLKNGYFSRAYKCKYIQNLRTSQGYIFLILQQFPEPNFSILLILIN
jgi:hypothetical protein